MVALRRVLCAVLGGQQPAVDWFHDDERYIDVTSFHRLERLQVHEARTLADLGSGVVRASEQEKVERERRLQFAKSRSQRRKVA